jgi:hypothetical protein
MKRGVAELQQTVGLQKEDDAVDDLRDSLSGDVDSQVSLGRSLVDIIDASEALDLSPACLGIQTPSVSLLSVLQRGVDVNEEEVGTGSTILQDGVLGGLSGSLVGSGRGSDDGCTSAGELRGDESDTLEVGVSVFSRVSEFGREFLSDGFAEEEGDASAALLVEGGLQSSGDDVFARVVETGEEEDETLLVSWGVALSEDLYDFPVDLLVRFIPRFR